MILFFLACSPDSKKELEAVSLQVFAGELVVDLQPNIWPNVISEEDDIIVALLSRNGINPMIFPIEEITMWDSDGLNSNSATEDLGGEDIDGDGALDRLIRFNHSTLNSSGILQGSGRIKIQVEEFSAWDQYSDTSRPFFLFPEPQGEYPVGTIQYEWEDSQRIDDITGGIPYRRLSIQVWYPGAVSQYTQPTDHYLNREEGISLATGWGIFPRYYDYLHSKTYHRVPLSDAQMEWPVLIFSHGYGVQLQNQALLVQDIASHGFIVVGIQHTYSTPVTIFQDGTIVTSYINPSTENTSEVQDMWTKDQLFILDQLSELNTSDPLFQDRIDLDKIGVFGYSFGGSTSAELCRRDSRVLAGLNIDGSFYGDTEEGFDQDFFLVNASSNFQDGSREPLLNSVRGQAYSLTIATARHSNFDDFAIQGDYISELIGGGDPGLGIGSIDPSLAYDIVHQYTRAFFQQHVRGEEALLLTETSPWDEAEYELWTNSQ